MGIGLVPCWCIETWDMMMKISQFTEKPMGLCADIKTHLSSYTFFYSLLIWFNSIISRQHFKGWHYIVLGWHLKYWCNDCTACVLSVCPGPTSKQKTREEKKTWYEMCIKDERWDMFFVIFSFFSGSNNIVGWFGSLFTCSRLIINCWLSCNYDTTCE